MAAALTFLLVLTDMVVTVLRGETDAEPGSLGASGWFAILHERPLLAMRNWLINVANLLLSLPLFAALYAAHRRTRGSRWAGLALVLEPAATVTYVANNAAPPMLDLSGKYAAATSDEERAALLSAGQSVLARGEDFTPGAFPGFLLASLASVLMGLAAGAVQRTMSCPRAARC